MFPTIQLRGRVTSNSLAKSVHRHRRFGLARIANHHSITCWCEILFHIMNEGLNLREGCPIVNLLDNGPLLAKLRLSSDYSTMYLIDILPVRRISQNHGQVIYLQLELSVAGLFTLNMPQIDVVGRNIIATVGAIVDVSSVFDMDC